MAFGLGPGTSVFFSAGAYALEHYNNRFEDGYGAKAYPSASGAISILSVTGCNRGIMACSSPHVGTAGARGISLLLKLVGQKAAAGS